MKRNDLVADEVIPWGYLGRKRHRDRLTVHYRACASVSVLAEKKKKGERELYVLTSCWYQVVPSDFFPISSILNHLAVEPLNLSQVEVSHKAI